MGLAELPPEMFGSCPTWLWERIYRLQTETASQGSTRRATVTESINRNPSSAISMQMLLKLQLNLTTLLTFKWEQDATQRGET